MAASKHLDAFQQKHLTPGEVVVDWGEGYIGEMMGQGKDQQHNGVLVVTGERVVFYRKGFLGEVIESIPLKAITSIERKSMLGHHTVRLHTSHDALSFKTFKKPDEQALVRAVEAGRAASTPAAGEPATSPTEVLRQLAHLRDAGVLTEAEFQAKKAELLARL